MTTWRVEHGNCLDLLRAMPDASVDAVVTDPPYGLSFMGKKWDYDVPAVEVWAECLRVLKPGGHLLAFAGTRTQHRMAVRIEDAGFEIRDMIAWVYSTGFPKSLNVSKAMDGVHGKQSAGFNTAGGKDSFDAQDKSFRSDYGYKYEPATDLARQWQGWGTALKPALEPITMARKPFPGTVAANVTEWGTGAINVDGCRVGTEQTITTRNGNSGAHGRFGKDDRVFERVNSPGRWPANLIHDGSDEVVEGFPETKSGKPMNRMHTDPGRSVASGASEGGEYFHTGFGDSGSAARFFYCPKASKADRDSGCEGLEEQTPRGIEVGDNAVGGGRGSLSGPRRNPHPTVKPTALMQYLCRLVTPPGGTVLDPFTGSGSTGKAAILEGFNFIGFEREAEYVEIARRRIAKAAARPMLEACK